MPQFQLLLDEFFTYTKGYRSKLVRWDFNSPSPVCLPPCCPGVHTKVTLLNSLSFPTTCIHSQMKDDTRMVLVFVSTTRAALLSEQICILLLIRFLVSSSSVHLTIAITSTENTVERLPIGMIFLQLCKGPKIPTRKQS
jgi:hypothetical protein